jgi:hypothetical protein
MNSNKRLTRQKETEVATVIEDILESQTLDFFSNLLIENFMFHIILNFFYLIESVRTIEMMREGKDVDNVFAELYHSIQKLKNLQRSDRRVKGNTH